MHSILLYLICCITISRQACAMVQPTPTTTPQLTMNLYDDFSQAFHRPPSPPSPHRGDSSWQNVQLVQDAILASNGINLDATFLSVFIPHQEVSTAVPEITVLEKPIPFVIIQENNSAPSYSADIIDRTDNISQDTLVLIEQHRDSSITYEFHSSEISSWRELDCQYNQYGNGQNNSLNNYTTRHNVNNQTFWASQIPIRERYIYLLLPSNNPKALSAQLQVTQGGSLGISQEYFSQTIQDKYRNFLWSASGHFRPIDSPERQAQAFKILYPAIKAHFATDRTGLLHFLKENINISGAEKQYNIETEWSSYLASHTSIIESLNISEHTATPQTVKESTFLQEVGKLSALVGQGKLEEAKAILALSSQKIYKADVTGSVRNTMIQEHNCLCAQYTALTEKLFEKYKGDPYYQICDRFLQRGSMSLAEAYKILNARHQAANSLAYRMGYDLRNLSAKDRSLIFKEIDSRTKDTFGLKDLYDHKDLLNDKELNILKERLECFESTEKTDLALAQNESTAVAPHEETEPIEPSQNVQQEVSITASPPPLEPKEPKQKEESATDSQNKQIEKDGLKESSIYKKAIESIEKNVHRFEKIGINQLSKKVLRHIINHHYKIGEVAKRRDQTSMFKDDINLVDLILETLENGIEIEPGVKTYDFGKIIGHSLNGEPTTVIAVFLNSAKNMITTVFPR